MIRSLVVAGCLLAFSQSGTSNESPSAISYLNQMGVALQSLNYHGTVIYMHDGQVESMEIFHQNKSGGEVERLVHLSGEPREVIRKDNVVTCYMPDSRSVVVGKRGFNSHLLAKLATDFNDYVDTYTFTTNGKGRIAGRSARLITITPKDKYRYGYHLWISTEEALLLKSELLSPKGDVLEQLMFAQINIVDSIPDALMKPAISGETFTWHEDNSSAESNALSPVTWTVVKLPKGFKLTASSKQKMPNSEMPADHLVISDGLASISVYIEPFGVESQPFLGASKMGAVNIYGAMFDDFQVTVVGEVPQPTVRMIAESVALNAPQQLKSKAID